MRARRLRWAALGAVAVVAVGVGVIALQTGLLGDAERSSLDARFDVRGKQKPPSDVVLVEIDGRTLQRLQLRFPFARSLHGRVLRRLTAAGAKAVAYDVQFTEPTTPREDNALILAAAKTPRLVLSTTEVDKHGGTSVFGGDDVVRRVGARVGNTVIDVDPDGILRRFHRVIDGLESFPVVVAERVTGKRVGTGGFDSDGEALVDYAGPPDTVRHVSFVDVLLGRVRASLLRNKIVIVGASAPSLQDVHTTPTSARSEMTGIEFQANAIQTILDGFPLRETPGWLNVLLVVVLGLAAPAVAFRFGALPTTGIAFGLGVLYLVAAQLAFNGGDVIPVVSPLLALALGTLGTLGVLAFFAALERERVRAQFVRFVPERVVDDVLARTGGARLGGQRVEATVLFCDLRGSTAMLEGMSPEQGIEVVNRYLTAMTDAVVEHGGTLSGFRGDGLLAVFGAPLEQPDHAARALAAARDMAGRRLDAVNAGLEQDLQIGVGICSGEVMAGNVGSEQRMEYTAIGDAANVASRLEGMTKGTPHAVFLADATHDLLGDADGVVLVGDLAVAGRAGTVRVWTLA